MFKRAVAFRNVRDTVAIAMEHGEGRAALIVADDDCELARLLREAYEEGLPGARTVIYDTAEREVARAALDALGPGDLAVLLQSSVFRIPAFRIRVALFQRDVKVIEHANLDRMVGEEIEHYFDAMAYDPAYYRTVGHALKARIDRAASARVESGGETLVFNCTLESAKLNIGDFSGLKNFGSLFPIGEVFTEASDLERVSGRVQLYAFMDTTMRLDVPREPITLVVERGRVVDAVDSTLEFDRVLAMIRRDEGEVWLREFGFGMNRGFSRNRRVSDVAAFERVCGVHLSLGARHGVYKKPHLNHRQARYHVDSFVVTDRVWLDDRVVFEDGGWTVSDD
jgi:leucyl aminopeptidase (aminopeptidase T)